MKTTYGDLNYKTSEIQTRLERMNLVPTMDHVPGEADKTFTDVEGQHTFLIGDFSRYFDAEKKEYKFYQLYDITVDGLAVWKEAGSGSGGVKAEQVTVNIISNQGAADSNIIGKSVTIEHGKYGVFGASMSFVYNGLPVQFSIEAGEDYKVIGPLVDGYVNPVPETFLAEKKGRRTINLNYSTEKVVLKLTLDGDLDLSQREVRVVDSNGKVLVEKTYGTGLILFVPTGITYTIVMPVVKGYFPINETYTSQLQTRELNLIYEKIPQSYLIINKTESVPTQKISVAEPEILNKILSKIHRYAGKLQSDGSMALAQLDDNKSSLYKDGTPALLDGREGDILTKIPELWYAIDYNDQTMIKYSITDVKAEGFHHVPESCVGTYKSFVENGKMYSRSGVTPSVNMVYEDFVKASKTRGEQYGLINYEQHCVLGMLLYAKYRTTDIQGKIGSSKATYKANNGTGSTNILGMTDTSKESCTSYVNALGIEGIFGAFYEYMEGVKLLEDIWKVTYMNGEIREIKTPYIGTGWISEMSLENGPLFDMIPVKLEGSSSIGYTDYVETAHSEYIDMCVARSCFTGDTTSAVADDGIGYLNATEMGFQPSAFFSSRLAYIGKMVDIDVAAFKALPIIN